jgi:hypothetical protein
MAEFKQARSSGKHQGKVRMSPVERNVSKVVSEFKKKYAATSPKKIKDFEDKYYEMAALNMNEFSYYSYNDHYSVKQNEKMEKKYYRFLYMYGFLHPRHEWNVGEDYRIFRMAQIYAVRYGGN